MSHVTSGEGCRDYREESDDLDDGRLVRSRLPVGVVLPLPGFGIREPATRKCET